MKAFLSETADREARRCDIRRSSSLRFQLCFPHNFGALFFLLRQKPRCLFSLSLMAARFIDSVAAVKPAVVSLLFSLSLSLSLPFSPSHFLLFNLPFFVSINFVFELLCFHSDVVVVACSLITAACGSGCSTDTSAMFICFCAQHTRTLSHTLLL